MARAAAAAAVLVAVGILAYANSLSGSFVLDDHRAIVENLSIRRLRPIGQAFSGNRPLINFSLAVNYALAAKDEKGDPDVRGFHLVNVTVHLLAGLVLLGVVRRTLLTARLRQRLAAAALPLGLLVAAIWTVHPLQTGSVTYLIQRSESMMGLFYLLTLYCVIRGASGTAVSAVEMKRTGGTPVAPTPLPRIRWVWYAAAWLACAAGMACKEVMATAPLVVLIYDRIFLGGSVAETFRRRWGLYAALAMLWLIPAGLLLAAELQAAGFGIKTTTPLEYALTQFGVILHYLRLAIWPDALCLDYAWPPAGTFWRIVPPALAVLALLGGTAAALWRRPAWGFPGVWFFIILAPTSSIMPLGDYAFEHRMYLPLAAVVALVVLGAYWLGGKLLSRSDAPAAAAGALAAAAALAVVATLATLTFQRNKDYRDEVSIWEDTVHKYPEYPKPRAHYGLGAALHEKGSLDKAILHYEKALEYWPEWAKAHYNLANALAAKGRYHASRAEKHYKEALRINPKYGEAHNNFGSLLAKLRRIDEAEEHFRLAVQYTPHNAGAHFNLAIALVLQRKPDEARKHFAEALRLKPGLSIPPRFRALLEAPPATAPRGL